MSDVIRKFCRHFDYPAEAEKTLLEAENSVLTHPDAKSILKNTEHIFWQAYDNEKNTYVDLLDRIAELTELHRYTIYLLFFVLQSPEMVRRYMQVGLPEQICRDSLLDLKWKMQKTHRIWGVWGVFSGDWSGDFFHLERFALGRLEFEVVKSECTYTDGTNTVNAGAPVIAVHIPASGRLTHDAVVDSYQQAEVFFKDRFPNGPIPFCCETWMLYPNVAALFPEGNIRRFISDYTVALGRIDPEQDDRWRVFHCPNETPIQNYPEETNLQKNLKKWLLQGNRMGIGIGYFFFENGQFVK